MIRQIGQPEFKDKIYYLWKRHHFRSIGVVFFMLTIFMGTKVTKGLISGHASVNVNEAGWIRSTILNSFERLR
jgi:hypothetical protein